MLDVCLEPRLTEESAPIAWEDIPSRAAIPSERDGYFNHAGPTRPSFDEKRSLHRFHLRERAVLRVGEDYLAGYSRDVSRSGVGLISPVQLFPLDEVQIWLPHRGRLDLRVVRCRRLAEKCYACGVVYVAGSQGE